MKLYPLTYTWAREDRDLRPSLSLEDAQRQAYEHALKVSDPGAEDPVPTSPDDLKWNTSGEGETFSSVSRWADVFYTITVTDAYRRPESKLPVPDPITLERLLAITNWQGLSEQKLALLEVLNELEVMTESERKDHDPVREAALKRWHQNLNALLDWTDLFQQAAEHAGKAVVYLEGPDEDEPQHG